MIREIDRIMVIRDKLIATDKKALDNALNVINDSFKTMIMSTKSYLLNGETEEMPLSDAKIALNTLNELAKKVDEEFPVFDTDEKVIAYILEYGLQIVKTRG